MILAQKLENPRLIPSEDLFFIFILEFQAVSFVCPFKKFFWLIRVCLSGIPSIQIWQLYHRKKFFSVCFNFKNGPDGRCFHAAWAVSKSAH